MKQKVVFIAAGLFAVEFCFSSSVFADPKVSQQIEVGFQQKHVDSPESKFEEYGEVPNGIVIDHYQINAEGESTGFEFDADHVDKDNQSADFEVKGARYDLEGSWNQIPHLISKESRTLYSDDGHGNLTIPDPIQANLQAGGASQFVTNFSSFAAGAHLQELKTITSRGNIGLGFDLSEALKLNISASEDMKKGYKAQGMRIDSDPVEFARPIDFKTYNSNVGLGYSGKDLQWGLTYAFSSFKDGLDSVTIDNPGQLNTTTTKSGFGRISVEPDNYQHSINFDGGLNLPAHSRFNAKTSFIYMRQDQGLIPYTSNTSLVGPTPLPTDKVDAKTLNWVQDYNLNSRLTKTVDFGLKFHSDQLHNKTSQINFPGYMDTESVWKTTPVSNEPFSFRKNALSGNAGWQVAAPLNLNLKYGAEWINRDDREIRNNRENTVKLAADYTPFTATLVRLSYLNARRRMQDDVVIDTSVFASNTRFFDIADRDRNQGNILIQVNPGRWSVAVNGGLGHDMYLPGKGDLTAGNTNYANSFYGLVESRTAKAGLDIDYDLSDRVGLNTYYEYQQDKSFQRGDSKTSNQVSATDGTFLQREENRYDMGGLGVNIRGIKDVVDLNFGYDVTASKGNTDFASLDSVNATKVSPPESKTVKQDFSIKGKVHATSNLAFDLSYTYEKYDVYFWASDNLGLIAPSTTATGSAQRNIFLGDATHDYRAHIVSLFADYKF